MTSTTASNLRVIKPYLGKKHALEVNGKYSRRERDMARDFMHKLMTKIVKELATLGFESDTGRPEEHQKQNFKEV